MLFVSLDFEAYAGPEVVGAMDQVVTDDPAKLNHFREQDSLLRACPKWRRSERSSPRADTQRRIPAVERSTSASDWPRRMSPSPAVSSIAHERLGGESRFRAERFATHIAQETRVRERARDRMGVAHRRRRDRIRRLV